MRISDWSSDVCSSDLALAFKAGLFNIGGAGQLIVGAMAAAWVGITFDLPQLLHLPLALLAGMVGGGSWGAVIGFLKARTGAHEVILSIMLNFVALRLLDYALSTDTFRRPGRSDPISPEMPDSEIGRAHVCTPVTHAHLVCRLM